MRLMVTDSGLGGLSVCAGLEQALAEGGHDVELLYINATPDDRIGYNALKSQNERIDLFNRFLKGATSRYTPDAIVIACNTLSVIYEETAFSRETKIPVLGIVDAGVKMVETALEKDPDRDVIIFATETTTEANTYPVSIRAGKSQVLAQECPELAHAISNDATGAAANQLIQRYAQEAVGGYPATGKRLFAFLGCTHYGYQSALFEANLAQLGFEAQALDPNHLLVEQVLQQVDLNAPGDLRVRFISRYVIPDPEIQSMEAYLSRSAPATLKALEEQELDIQLFQS